MTNDLGLTHIALPIADVDKSIEFYATYARMQMIHRHRVSALFYGKVT